MRLAPPALALCLFQTLAAPALAQIRALPSPAPTPLPPAVPAPEAGPDPRVVAGAYRMEGALGPYPLSREASGTSWQPEATPHQGIHWMAGPWMGMVHGFIDLVYDYQGGRRGDDQLFAPSMFMGTALRPVGGGTLGLRAMVSSDPASIGTDGYPLLLQTGETADGVTPLIDRQHPHDAIMELALTYSWPLGARSSVFAYAGMPGEPALGPPTFMHRFSAASIPESPIGHHWLDSTHVSHGVLTGGAVWHDVKVEGSAFDGREPDQHRWNIEDPELNSYSARVSWNPRPAWALQGSYGHLQDPEQLEPGVDVDRGTVSMSYHHSDDEEQWQTTLAWGRNNKHPGPTTDVFLLETTYRIAHHTTFARAEVAEKDELVVSGPLAHRVFTVAKMSAGYLYDFPALGHVVLGAGFLGSLHLVPEVLEASYGHRVPASFMVFARAQLR